MTTGQRIALKRKELGLSQEALGEKLGVSRQAIYKWESDTALPEIEKLIALSRLFGISIGALLGVEEESTCETASADELTEAQLKMVEEITRRYIDAIPKTAAPKRHPVLRFLLAAAILFAGWKLYEKLDNVEQQYRNLSNQVQYVQRDVENSISGITSRVENILEAQNSLTADRDTAIVSTDLRNDGITFSFRAVPKTFTADTIAYIEVNNLGVIETFGPFSPEGNQTFTGEVTTTLSDHIILSVVFEDNGVRQTQILKEYTDLRFSSLPTLWVRDDFWHMDLNEPYVLEFPSKFNEGQIVNLNPSMLDVGKQLAENEPSAEIKEINVGLFLNKKLVAWADPIPVPENYIGFDDHLFFRFPDLRLELKEDDILCTGVLATDTYGRVLFDQSTPVYPAEEGTILLHPESYQQDNDPANYTFN